MKKIVFSIVALLGMAFAMANSAAAQQENKTYFPYPTVPDSLTTLQKRTDYLMRHFWDRCEMKKAFSNRPKMRQCLADYLSFIPYASSDSVHQSLDRFLKSLEKQPDDLLFIAEEAEYQLLGDSAQYISEEVFLPFANAVARNKKIAKADKMRFQRLATIYGNTQIGVTAPDLAYIDRDGQTRHLAADTAQVVIIYFNDPDCSDCHLARVRLAADIKARQLVSGGLMKIVCITPSEPTDEWREGAASYPKEWIVGAAADADDIYDIPKFPSFYILGEDNKIVVKNLDINQVLTVLSRL